MKIDYVLVHSVSVIIWFRVQFGENMHVWVFEKRLKSYESEGQVQFKHLSQTHEYSFTKLHEKP